MKTKIQNIMFSFPKTDKTTRQHIPERFKNHLNDVI